MVGFFLAFRQGCHGISPFSCSPPSLGIVLELHAHAEGMGSSRGKMSIVGGRQGRGDPALAGGALGIQPGRGWIWLCGVSSMNKQHKFRVFQSRVR